MIASGSIVMAGAVEHEYQTQYQQAPSGADPIFMPEVFSDARKPLVILRLS